MVIIRGTVFNTSALATFFSPEGCCLISVKTGRIQLESNLVKQDKMFILTFVVYNLDSIIFELLIQLELEYKCPCGGGGEKPSYMLQCNLSLRRHQQKNKHK